MKIAYFDCFCGAGGDMIAAAMIDAGLDPEFLKSQLATLDISVQIRITSTQRAGLRAMRFEPIIGENQSHRNIEQITRIIQNSGITERAKSTAIKIFNKLAQAEAVVHGKDFHHVHLHEAGSLDSIIDVVSACIGIEALKVEKVYCSPLRLGAGIVNFSHGRLPVPAPATAELVKGVPVQGGPIEAELLTPTAAAILTTISEKFCHLPEMRIESIGYGAGSLNPTQRPNVLRLILGHSTAADSAEVDTVCLLQTNIDDVSAELLGFSMEKLLEIGALDVFATAVTMKHSRPAVELSVLCTPADAPNLERYIFEQGLSFGIRKQFVQRTKLARRYLTVQTEYGPIKIKIGSLSGRILAAKPEFSDCAAAAKKYNVAAKTVIEAAMAAYRKSQIGTDS